MWGDVGLHQLFQDKTGLHILNHVKGLHHTHCHEASRTTKSISAFFSVVGCIFDKRVSINPVGESRLKQVCDRRQ